MQTKERIFHAVTFEAIALAIIIPTTALLTGKATGDLAIVGVGLSLFTVVWNYFYNILFDRWFGSERSNRSLALRIGHTFGFEGGLIFLSVPTIAWFLQIGIGAALLLEAGFLVFFFFYATGFNWVYDRIQPYRRLFTQNVVL
ncbi:PACE efflux transporter [Vibrio renipiscarius]|uniref:Membrane protein n=1 Tax=Vibrio renipiscarius TaxID=1461322 RepID=A0A0C2NBR1_9VIBR|nr:PACE efflux transporter [Vibrio renipiscarius]KII77066.1 membrane protein [Vibrio renipiscarius]KII77196.1 membrane protein [Vibrio renipiscarius]